MSYGFTYCCDFILSKWFLKDMYLRPLTVVDYDTPYHNNGPHFLVMFHHVIIAILSITVEDLCNCPTITFFIPGSNQKA